MSRDIRRGLAASLLMWGAVGCADDDIVSAGQIGEQGIVRFSQIVQFAETEDFRSPIAQGASMVVALQKPKDSFLDNDTFVDLQLSVRRLNGERLDTIYPLGFGQYGVQFREAGTFQLIAETDAGTAIDGLNVVVRAYRRLDLSRRFVVTTRVQEPSSCTRVIEFDNLAEVVLHTNQTLQMFVVPRDERDAPMLGLLPLTAIGPDSVTLDAPLVGGSEFANSLIVTPVGDLEPQLRLDIVDGFEARRLEISVRAENASQPLNDCN